METFGEQVRIYRERKEWTQGKLASLSKMTRARINQIENNNALAKHNELETLYDLLEIPRVPIFNDSDRYKRYNDLRDLHKKLIEEKFERLSKSGRVKVLKYAQEIHGQEAEVPKSEKDLTDIDF